MYSIPRRPRPNPALDGFCADKEDGNYAYPKSCTYYVACVAQLYVYPMICAEKNGCPLHYVARSGPDPTTSRCDYPEVAGCDEIDDCPGGNPGEGDDDLGVDDSIIGDYDVLGEL